MFIGIFQKGLKIPIKWYLLWKSHPLFLHRIKKCFLKEKKEFRMKRILLVLSIIFSFNLICFNLNAQTQYVNKLGSSSGWYSDDTRNATGANLVGSTLTHYGKPGQTPTAVDDIAIAQQISFDGGPNGIGALKMNKTSTSGGYSKCTMSKIDENGFATGDSWLNTFFCNYRYYTNSSAEFTVPKIGIQTTAWSSSQTGFTAQRSGESAWDIILVDWRGTDPPWTVGSWAILTTDKNTVCWKIYRQAGNNYHPAPPTEPMSLQQIKDHTTWGPLIFGSGAKVTSFQLGVGSSSQTSTSYIDWVETNLLNNGNRIDFVAPPVHNITQNTFYYTIQSAINAANAGDEIHVDDGTYNENININKSLTVKGKNPPTSTALITGKVVISADNVTLENFKIDPPAFSPTYDAAVYVQASNVIIKNNIITDVDGPADKTNKNIHIYKGSTPNIENITIEKNIIEENRNSSSGAVGVMVQGYVKNVYILDNIIRKMSGAWCYGIEIAPTAIFEKNSPEDVFIKYNSFSDLSDGGIPSTGTGVAVSFAKYSESVYHFTDPLEVIINFNDFGGPSTVPIGVLHIAEPFQTKSVNAKYNWWGHCEGPTVDNLTAMLDPEKGSHAVTYGSTSCLIDYTPWLGNSFGDAALWLSPITAKRIGDERLANWLSMDCGNREAVQNAEKRKPIYSDGWVKFESDFGANKYGYSDVMEVQRYGDITATDGGSIDKWHPSNEKRNLFVTFKTGYSVDNETEPPVYYRDGRQCIFEAGGPLSGYNLYIVEGKLVFGMWNRFESKYTILEAPSTDFYPLTTNKTYYTYLYYDGSNFTATISDGSFTSFSSPSVAFSGLSQDAEDKSGIGGAARTRYHDYSVGSTYSDEFDGLLGDIIIYSGDFSNTTGVSTYLNARYGVPNITTPRITADDWKIIAEYDRTGENNISSAYPNPFDSKTSIGINLLSEQMIKVELLDVMGRKVALVFNGKLAAGIHDIEIDGTGLSNGIYFIKVAGETFTQTTQVILNK